MRLTIEQYQALVAAGILGPIELIDGVLVLAGCPFALPAAQRQAAADAGIDLDDEPDAVGEGTGSIEPLSIELDDEHAAKLQRLADQMQIEPGTVARTLLSVAIDQVDPHASNVSEMLDGLHGAYERGELGRRHASADDTIPLDES